MEQPSHNIILAVPGIKYVISIPSMLLFPASAPSPPSPGHPFTYSVLSLLAFLSLTFAFLATALLSLSFAWASVIPLNR